MPLNAAYSRDAVDEDVDMGFYENETDTSDIQRAVLEQFAILNEQAEQRALFGDGAEDDDDITLSTVTDQMRIMGMISSFYILRLIY